MSLPTPFVQNYGYASDRNLTGSTGNHLDNEFAEIASVTNAICNSIALVLRDDGAMRNQTVHSNAFTSDALALIAGQQNGDALRWTPLGFWVTATVYDPTDIVETGSPGVAYVCTTTHISGTFANDHVAGYWVVLSSPRTLTSGDVTSALGYTPVDVAGDTMTGPLVLANNSSLLGAPWDGVNPGVGMTIDNSSLSTNALVTVDKGFWASILAVLPDPEVGFKADVVRAAQNEDTSGAEFNSYVDFLLTGDTFGLTARAVGFVGHLAELTAARIEMMNASSTSTTEKVGARIKFKNRQFDSDSTPGTYDYSFPLGAGDWTNVGGIGSDFYNRNSIGLKIESQEPTAAGERCGWGRGIVFGEYALDKHTTALGLENATAIDFSHLHYYGGVNPENAYRMEGVIAMRDLMQIWWNKTPDIANPNKVKTYFNLFNGRWVLTINNIERFGVDVNTGDFYQNGVLFGGGGGGGGNNTWTGTNTFQDTVTFEADTVWSGAGRRITGQMTANPPVDRLSVQTSEAASATEFQILPSVGGTAAGISVFTDPLVVAGQFGRMSVEDGVEVLFESNKLGASAYVPFVWNTAGTDQMTLSTTGQLLIGTSTAAVTGGKLRVNGIVQIDNPVAFSVNRGAGAGTFAVNNDTVTAVTWTTEEFDTGTAFDLATGRFTPVAGKYSLSGCATGAWVAQGQYTVAIYKNGSPHKNGSRVQADNTAGGFIGANVSVTVDANGTDYFDFRVYQTNPATSAVNYLDIDVLLYFTGHRVG